MFEKVSMAHPDKVADRIAGALVDLAYSKSEKPKIAVEVLLGHGHCTIIIESSENIVYSEVLPIVERLAGKVELDYFYSPQDPHLADNQKDGIKCGDNGIFKGVPVSSEEERLTDVAKEIYEKFPYDGKYLIDGINLTICQSNAPAEYLKAKYCPAVVNPLGDWTGGINVDSGATNRKLGSDMGRAATGGGLHGKDLSKADVTVNIWCHLMAQLTGQKVKAMCNIGDKDVRVWFGDHFSWVPFGDMVEKARSYIKDCGGFEKFAEWGLIS